MRSYGLGVVHKISSLKESGLWRGGTRQRVGLLFCLLFNLVYFKVFFLPLNGQNTGIKFQKNCRFLAPFLIVKLCFWQHHRILYKTSQRQPMKLTKFSTFFINCFELTLWYVDLYLFDFYTLFQIKQFSIVAKVCYAGLFAGVVQALRKFNNPTLLRNVLAPFLIQNAFFLWQGAVCTQVCW